MAKTIRIEYSTIFSLSVCKVTCKSLYFKLYIMRMHRIGLSGFYVSTHKLDLTRTFNPTYPHVLSETKECFFFSLNSAAKRRLYTVASDSACLRAARLQRPALEVYLIRCSAGCPASIRNPFIESDLFFRRTLKGTSPLWRSFFLNRLLV